jgi:hypothetical protein
MSVFHTRAHTHTHRKVLVLTCTAENNVFSLIWKKTRFQKGKKTMFSVQLELSCDGLHHSHTRGESRAYRYTGSSTGTTKMSLTFHEWFQMSKFRQRHGVSCGLGSKWVQVSGEYDMMSAMVSIQWLVTSTTTRGEGSTSTEPHCSMVA